ncbi:MAG: glycosyltransferase family 2 protein [Betaproteobacteria bacterium]|nr:glycosyltransferase family 2 protein [Betaproteobacteria bacterium]MDH5350183.1 glycosyltransferase family 2 protein [Betaproteobacteria bacterium]
MARTCSIIVLQYNHADLTRQCLASLRAHVDRRHQLILVDNHSTEPAARELGTEFPDIELVACAENGGFSRGNNAGAARATGDVLLFLNNDTLVEADLVAPLLRRFDECPRAAIVGPKLLNADGSFQLSAGRLPSFAREIVDKAIAAAIDGGNRTARRLVERGFATARSVEWVTGAALAVRRDVFDRLGGFDPSFFMFFEDKDLCARVRQAGFEVWFEPAAELRHLRGGSANPRTARIYRASQVRYYRLHRPRLEQGLLGAYLRLGGKYPAEHAAADSARHR